MSRHGRWRWFGVAVAVLIIAGLAFLVFRRLTSGSEEDSERGGPTPVVLAQAQGGRLGRTIQGVATVESAESVIVTAEAAGRVAEVRFTNGQSVRKGQPLFRMEFDQEAADVAAAEAAAEELRQRLGRLQRLVAEGAVARGQVEDVRRQVQAADARAASLRTLLRDTVIRAPFAGVVGLREVSPGALVQPGDELVTLNNSQFIKLRFALPEQQIAQVRIGAPVEATSPAFPNRTFRGEVTGIDSRLGVAQRTLEVEARLPNAEGLWRAGMLADVSVTTDVVQAVTVPPIAVQVRGDVQFVYRSLQNCAQRVEVEVGQRAGQGLEIRRGLQAGDLVVVEGFQDLSTGQPIRPVRQGGGPPASGEQRREGREKSGRDKKEQQEAQRQEAERCKAVTSRQRPAAVAGGA